MCHAHRIITQCNFVIRIEENMGKAASFVTTCSCYKCSFKQGIMSRRTELFPRLLALSASNCFLVYQHLMHCASSTYRGTLCFVLQVLSRVPLSLAPTGGPIHLTHARGYLFLAAPTGVAVFNTTGFSNRRSPRMILAHPYSNVASAEDMVSHSMPA